MSTPLERFIRNHRDDFDTDQPDPQLWKRLENKMHSKPKSGSLFFMSASKWIAAASFLLISGLVIIYLLNKPVNNEGAKPVAGGNTIDQQELIADINPRYAKELYHFTQLIELKQHELNQIREDEPELYKKFLDDITRLDSSYNNLQNLLPVNPNREQLLEAMIQNLRLQTDLLNQQLLIIQKIKQLKTNQNENSSSI